MVEAQINAPEVEAQMAEIVEFLDQKQARDQALDIILSFTKTMVNRRNFLKTDVIKKLLNLILEWREEEDVTSKCYQCLINFALDKSYITKCVENNAARKTFEFLMHNVKPTSSSIRTANATIAKEKIVDEVGGVFDIYEIKAG
jgi:hypothetical protein